MTHWQLGLPGFRGTLCEPRKRGPDLKPGDQGRCLVACTHCAEIADVDCPICKRLGEQILVTLARA